jgi:hypothetical protein
MVLSNVQPFELEGGGRLDLFDPLKNTGSPASFCKIFNDIISPEAHKTILI